MSDEKIEKLVKNLFNFTPKKMIEKLDLRRPIYLPTAAYGHFGRADKNFTWEKLDSVDVIMRTLR
jgi:S-adenosylmethionine synthetase